MTPTTSPHSAHHRYADNIERLFPCHTPAVNLYISVDYGNARPYRLKIGDVKLPTDHLCGIHVTVFDNLFVSTRKIAGALDTRDYLLFQYPTMSFTDHSASRIKLFRNEHFERLTLISPRTFASFWGVALPFIGWAGWDSVNAWSGLELIVAGVLVWTLFEYAMHRYLFHLETKVPILKWFVHLIHGNHHENPNDPLRGLMPLPASLPIAALVWLAFDFLLGAPGTWLFLGFMIGYVLYDAIHFACHHCSMESKLASAIKRHHMRHHYVDDNKNFAILAIFWDRVFGSRITSLNRTRRDYT